MDAEEIDAAAAAAELNILGGLASVTGLQSPAVTRCTIPSVRLLACRIEWLEERRQG